MATYTVENGRRSPVAFATSKGIVKVPAGDIGEIEVWYDFDDAYLQQMKDSAVLIEPSDSEPEASDPDEAEKATLKARLNAARVEYRSNASLTTLRDLVRALD